MSLKILIDGPRLSAREAHARLVVRGLQKDDEKFPSEAMPRGIVVRLARYVEVCDDCGGTYWAANKWASHIGCKGSPKSGVGF